jgi:hypothetical protein
VTGRLAPTRTRKQQLWDLAVAVRRTVPRELNGAQIEALIAEYSTLRRWPYEGPGKAWESRRRR